LVPETRLLTLEQLDHVFAEMDFKDFARHAIRSLLWLLHIVEKPKNLYESGVQNFEEGVGLQRFVLHAFGPRNAPESSSADSTLAANGEDGSSVKTTASHHEIRTMSGMNG